MALSVSAVRCFIVSKWRLWESQPLMFTVTYGTPNSTRRRAARRDWPIHVRP